MLPPVDPTVLATLPQFNALYTHLTTNLLNTDGSTKRSKPTDTKAKDELVKLQRAHAQRTLLRQVIGTLPGLENVTDDFEDDLLLSASVVGQMLNAKSPLSAVDLEILAEDREFFLENVDEIGSALSIYLERTAFQLSQIADLLSNNSSTLTATVQTLQDSASDLTTIIIASRLSCLDQLVSLLTLHRELTSTTIHILENAVHGTLSRAVESRSKYLATVAESMQLKLTLQKRDALQLLHDYPGTKDALSNYEVHLQDTMQELERRERRAQRVLEKYRSLGDGWTTLRERLDNIDNEIENVTADLARLEKGDKDAE